MNIHNDIMNIPFDNKTLLNLSESHGVRLAYKLGHRDARYAAAELSLEAERRIQELEQELRQVKESIDDNPADWCCSDCGSDIQSPKSDHPAWINGKYEPLE